MASGVAAAAAAKQKQRMRLEPVVGIGAFARKTEHNQYMLFIFDFLAKLVSFTVTFRWEENLSISHEEIAHSCYDRCNVSASESNELLQRWICPKIFYYHHQQQHHIKQFRQ